MEKVFDGEDEISAELTRVILVELYLNSLNYDAEDDELFQKLMETHLEDYDSVLQKFALLYPYAARKINFAEVLDNLLGAMYYYDRDLKIWRETYLTNSAFAISAAFVTYIVGINLAMKKFEIDNNISDVERCH